MLTFDADAHRYAFNGVRVENVTTVLRSALGDPFERVARDVLELARQRGKAAHLACQLDDAGTLDEASVDARILPYVDAWRLFRRQWRFDVNFAEVPLYSPTYGYAGTPDVVATSADGQIICIDRKTGLPGAFAALQTAAYATLVAERFALHWNGIRRFALRMMPDGKYRFHEYDSPADWRDFLSCLNVHRIKERIAA